MVLGRETWNSAYTDHWPKESEEKPLLQAIKHIEGWAVSFQIQAPTHSSQTVTVLVGKNGVVHWRKAWPALPPGLQQLDTKR